MHLDGHVVDSLVLAKVLDAILDAGASYEILTLEVGTTATDQSHVRLRVRAADEAALDALLLELQVHGVNREDISDAEVVRTDADGVFPEGFYSTTNLPTWVRVNGHWTEAPHPEMDCGLVVSAPDNATATATDRRRVDVVPMHRVKAGDDVVVGWKGVRVEGPRRTEETEGFGFMTSEVSSEKPKGLSVVRVADALRRVRARARRRNRRSGARGVRARRRAHRCRPRSGGIGAGRVGARVVRR